jgi:hypothetical protein
MMKHGRKFVLSVFGVVLTFALCIASLIVLKAEGAAVLTAGITGIGVIVTAFNAGNAYATSHHTATPKGGRE